MNGMYYVLVRLKLNNSNDYKFYLLENDSEYKDFDYYTLTKDEKNNKIEVKFNFIDYNGKQMTYFGLNVSEAGLPEDIYDFVIDPRTWWN